MLQQLHIFGSDIETVEVQMTESSPVMKDFNPLMSISVVCIDYCMSNFTASEEEDGMVESSDSPVPVVRIFGSTCSEKRACVYIHGVSFSRLK